MTDISREQFAAYEAVRRSGVTNMFAVSLVAELSGLTRQQVLAIMERYAELKQQYSA